MATLDISSLETRLEKLGLGPLPRFSEAHVLNRPLDIGRSYLADILGSLTECDPIAAYNSIQWPNDVFTADLTVPLPKLRRDVDPTALGIEIIQKFPNCPLFIRPLRDGVHLRIFFMSKTLPRLLLPYINDRMDSYGRDPAFGLHDPCSPELGRKTLVIEFSSPNIASGFHAKHLRSTILGAYVANLYENMGWNVVKINYLGDWGKQIGLLGAGWERFGSEEEFQTNPARHILNVYNQIDELFQPEQAASRAARDGGEDTALIENHGLFAERNAFFKRMEHGDEKTLALWKRFRDASIDYYAELYASFNISFTEYSGESQVSTETMDEIEGMLKSQGISEESEGSWIVDLKKHTDRPGRVIIRDRNGSRTYHLRELAAILDRSRKYHFDKMIYVVADDHDMHFQRIFKIIELLGMSDLSQKLQHVHFNKGSQISKKLGQDQMLDEILNQCKNAMHNSLTSNPEKAALLGDSDEGAVNVGISALLAQELSAKRASDYSFDLGKMTAFGRGTGPELQYWYAKLSSIVKAADSNLSDLSDEDFNSIEEEKFDELLRILAQYPDITSSAYKSLEPFTITLYLINITDQLYVCFEEDEVKKDVSHTPAQVALYKIVRQVLDNSMRVLGIIPTTK